MADISRVIEQLPSNPYLFLLLAFCTAVSVPLSVYLFFRSVRDRRPRYSLRTRNIIHGGVGVEFPDLEVHYRGTGDKITTFSSTKVLFFNAGREPISRGDVVKGEPITVSLAQGCVILAADIIQQKEESNEYEFVRSRDRTHATLTFGHMAKDEGVVLQVLHTGAADADVRVTGKLRDGNRPQPLLGEPYFKMTQSILEKMASLYVGLILLMAFQRQEGVLVMAYVIPLVLVLGTVVWLRVVYRRPKGFETFYEEPAAPGPGKRAPVPAATQAGDGPATETGPGRG
jgi:hypothetical protein